MLHPHPIPRCTRHRRLQGAPPPSDGDGDIDLIAPVQAVGPADGPRWVGFLRLCVCVCGCVCVCVWVWVSLTAAQPTGPPPARPNGVWAYILVLYNVQQKVRCGRHNPPSVYLEVQASNGLSAPGISSLDGHRHIRSLSLPPVSAPPSPAAVLWEGPLLRRHIVYAPGGAGWR